MDDTDNDRTEPGDEDALPEQPVTEPSAIPRDEGDAASERSNL